MRSDRARVLVVDDDVQVRAIMRRLIGGDHDVTLASNAVVALDLIRNGERYETILCDVNLSPMTGYDFWRVLAVENPDQANAIIFVTGGINDPAMESELARLPNLRLSKPFTASDLRGAILRREQR